MTFEIDGDILRHAGRPVAKLLLVHLAFRRALEDDIRDFTTADDFDAEHREALKAEYDEGFDAGKAEGINEAENKFEDEKEEIRAEGFKEGYERANLDMAHAADTTRVNALLQALSEIHDKLLPLYLGIVEPGQFKRRPAKLSELKAAANSCCASARMAVNAFRAE